MGGRGPVRILGAVLAAASLVRAPLAGMASADAGTAAPRRELFKDSRALLAMARAEGKRDLSLVIASTAAEGSAKSVAREIGRLGGTVRVLDEEIGYVRGRVPIDRVEDMAAFGAVQAIDVDQDASGIPPYLQPGLHPENPEARLPTAGAAGPAAPDEWPPSRADLTLRPIYSPLKDLGAADFRRDHPGFDGRGVTVAVLDGNVDILLPEFQVATGLDGRPTRKIVDLVNSMDPLEPEADFPHWISMREHVAAEDGRFVYAGDTYTAPRPGTFAVGTYDLCRFAPYVQAYFRTVLDRPERGTSVDRPITVLWDEATGDVWVDVNQNHSFADEPAVRDFRERYDYALLGGDDPDTPVRESIPLVVQTDRATGFLALNPAMYGHSTMVSGALLASRGESGRFNGVAPGARLVSIFQGSTTHGMIEGLIRAFKDPRIDAVLLEQNVYIAMPYMLTDGRFTVTVLCSRLIEKYRKPFLSPANNSPGLNTVEEHGLARWGFGVGAYESRENFLANRAVRVFEEDNLHWVGSWGPSGNGTLQPDILAPSEVLTTYPASRSADTEGLAGAFAFPPGYAMCGGTSCATPVATGAVALLLSAARQSGLKPDPRGIYESVTGTARYLPNMPAYWQGNGLIQVGAAWNALQAIARRTGAPTDIRTQGPVKTALSPWLEPPDSGPGIYEREGWAAGQTGERTIQFTRTSGPAAAEPYRLRWIGNDGTFSCADSITLARGATVPLRVRVAPGTSGAHSALLSIERPGDPLPAQRIMAVVVAAERFTAENKFSITRDVRAARPGASEIFFEVPPGVDAFKVKLQRPKDTVRMSLYPPDGREDSVFEAPKDAEQTRTIADPAPGVWAVVLHDMHDAFKFDESRPPTLPRTPVTLTASLVGVELKRPEAAAPGPNGASAVEISAVNWFAAFRGAIASQPLASVRERRESLAPRQQSVVDVTVPAGTQRLIVRLDEVSGDAGADIDMYLFDCSAGGASCESRRSRVGPGAAELLSLDGPAAGSWKVVLDGARLRGPVTLRYRDYFVSPALGAVAVADGPAERETGAAWSARASLWVAGAAPEGRSLVAMVSASAEGVAAARQIGGTDFASFDSWKVGSDAIPLGLATIRIESVGVGGSGAATAPAAGGAR